MSFVSLGDLASSFVLNRTRKDTQTRLATLSKELSTGRSENLIRRMSGDYGRLSSWENTISMGESLTSTLSESLNQIIAKANVVETHRSDLQKLANTAEITLASNQPARLKTLSIQAEGFLQDFTARTNSKTAQQSLFAGKSVNAMALAPAASILSSAKGALTGAITISDVSTQLANWLNNPASGFQVDAYLGGETGLSTVRLSESTLAKVPGRADGPAMKESISHLVLTALATDPDLNFSLEVQKSLISTATLGLRTAEGKLTELQANIGNLQSRIENSISRTNSHMSFVKRARNEAVSADSFETASLLRSSELQLEKIFMLTARSAKMTLLEYLK